ncbi:hypothetical protein N7470_003529 [Penicillium chermesinum]|nr:hypothetical protein N7470_003529 [Penicillium chermesinum]
MAPKNEFLDIETSDDEASARGYDSEEKAAEAKAAQDFFDLQSDDEEQGSGSDSEAETKGSKPTKGKSSKESKSKSASGSADAAADDSADPDEPSPAEKITKLTKLPGKLGKLGKPSKKEKRGVVYLSTLPPYMKPFALKNILEQRGFGPITKTFFTPKVEPSGARKRSNKRQMYTDGWIEFQSKRTAKLAAETMNAQTIGGHGYYADDLLNMKYLRGFKWDNLMEQQQRERAEREARQRIEDSRAKKEEKMFLAGVEAGRVADGMAKKNAEKRKRKAEAGEDVGEEPKLAVRRRFAQNEVVKAKKPDQGVVDNEAKRVLGKIF